MKKILIGLPMLLAAIVVTAQSKKHDSLAILIIDRMSDVIGELESCSYKLHIANDVLNPETGAGYVKRFTDCQVLMSGQNKMNVDYYGEKGHRQIWYNGEQLAYYFGAEKNYGILWAPSTTIEMIDTMNALYHIDFPAADFFYPTFTDDLLAQVDVLDFLGFKQVDGQECFHIVASNKDMDMQFWIANDSYNLPVRFVIVYKNKKGNPQYQASFSEWQVNPSLPVAMFDFQPPPGAAQLRILSKNDK